MSDSIPGTTGPDRRELFSLPHNSGPSILSDDENAVLQQVLAALPDKGRITLCRLGGRLMISPGRTSSLETDLLDEM